MNAIGLRVPTHSPIAVSSVFGDEAVIMSPSENVVRMLNSTASRIWQLADGTRTTEEIAQSLTTEFDVSLPHARQSVSLFIDEMVSKGMMTVAEG